MMNMLCVLVPCFCAMYQKKKNGGVRTKPVTKWILATLRSRLASLMWKFGQIQKKMELERQTNNTKAETKEKIMKILNLVPAEVFELEKSEHEKSCDKPAEWTKECRGYKWLNKGMDEGMKVIIGNVAFLIKQFELVDVVSDSMRDKVQQFKLCKDPSPRYQSFGASYGDEIGNETAFEKEVIHSYANDLRKQIGTAPAEVLVYQKLLLPDVIYTVLDSIPGVVVEETTQKTIAYVRDQLLDHASCIVGGNSLFDIIASLAKSSPTNDPTNVNTFVCHSVLRLTLEYQKAKPHLLAYGRDLWDSNDQVEASPGNPDMSLLNILYDYVEAKMLVKESQTLTLPAWASLRDYATYMREHGIHEHKIPLLALLLHYGDSKSFDFFDFDRPYVEMHPVVHKYLVRNKDYAKSNLSMWFQDIKREVKMRDTADMRTVIDFVDINDLKKLSNGSRSNEKVSEKDLVNISSLPSLHEYVTKKPFMRMRKCAMITRYMQHFTVEIDGDENNYRLNNTMYVPLCLVEMMEGELEMTLIECEKNGETIGVIIRRDNNIEERFENKERMVMSEGNLYIGERETHLQKKRFCVGYIHKGKVIYHFMDKCSVPVDISKLDIPSNTSTKGAENKKGDLEQVKTLLHHSSHVDETALHALQILKEGIKQSLKAYKYTSEYIEKKDLRDLKRELEESIKDMIKVDEILKEKRTWIQQNIYKPERTLEPTNYAQYKVVLQSYNEEFQVKEIEESHIDSYTCISCHKNTFWINKFDECTKILNEKEENKKSAWRTSLKDAYNSLVTESLTTQQISPVKENVNVMLKFLVKKSEQYVKEQLGHQIQHLRITTRGAYKQLKSELQREYESKYNKLKLKFEEEEMTETELQQKVEELQKKLKGFLNGLDNELINIETFQGDIYNKVRSVRFRNFMEKLECPKLGTHVTTNTYKDLFERLRVGMVRLVRDTAGKHRDYAKIYPEDIMPEYVNLVENKRPLPQWESLYSIDDQDDEFIEFSQLGKWGESTARGPEAVDRFNQTVAKWGEVVLYWKGEQSETEEKELQTEKKSETSDKTLLEKLLEKSKEETKVGKSSWFGLGKQETKNITDEKDIVDIVDQYKESGSYDFSLLHNKDWQCPMQHAVFLYLKLNRLRSIDRACEETQKKLENDNTKLRIGLIKEMEVNKKKENEVAEMLQDICNSELLNQLATKVEASENVTPEASKEQQILEVLQKGKHISLEYNPSAQTFSQDSITFHRYCGTFHNNLNELQKHKFPKNINKDLLQQYVIRQALEFACFFAVLMPLKHPAVHTWCYENGVITSDPPHLAKYARKFQNFKASKESKVFMMDELGKGIRVDVTFTSANAITTDEIQKRNWNHVSLYTIDTALSERLNKVRQHLNHYLVVDKPKNIECHERAATQKVGRIQHFLKKMHLKVQKEENNMCTFDIGDHMTAAESIDLSKRVHTMVPTRKHEYANRDWIPKTLFGVQALNPLFGFQSGPVVKSSGVVVEYMGMELHFAEAMHKDKPAHLYVWDDSCSIREGETIVLEPSDGYVVMNYNGIKLAVDDVAPSISKPIESDVENVTGFRVLLKNNVAFSVPRKKNIYRTYDDANVHHVLSIVDCLLNSGSVQFIMGAKCLGTPAELRDVRNSCGEVMPLVYFGDVKVKGTARKHDNTPLSVSYTHEQLKGWTIKSLRTSGEIADAMKQAPQNCPFCYRKSAKRPVFNFYV